MYAIISRAVCKYEAWYIANRTQELNSLIYTLMSKCIVPRSIQKRAHLRSSVLLHVTMRNFGSSQKKSSVRNGVKSIMRFTPGSTGTDKRKTLDAQNELKSHLTAPKNHREHFPGVVWKCPMKGWQLIPFCFLAGRKRGAGTRRSINTKRSREDVELGAEIKIHRGLEGHKVPLTKCPPTLLAMWMCVRASALAVVLRNAMAQRRCGWAP